MLTQLDEAERLNIQKTVLSLIGRPKFFSDWEQIVIKWDCCALTVLRQSCFCMGASEIRWISMIAMGI